MNNFARDVPASGVAPGPVAIECPQCRTQLRLLAQATIHTPISCCMCGATFYLQPVETAPLADDLVPPRRPGVPGPRAPFRVVISPPGRGPRRTEGPRATALTAPVPPAPSTGSHAAPGMPRPVELPDHLQRNFRTRWMESVLGAALVLLLIVAACAGGFVLIRTVWSNPAPVQRDATATDDKAAPPPDAATANAAPAGIGAVLGGPSQPLDRPARMAGTWESRADDGSHSKFTFFPDGIVFIDGAGEPPPPRLKAFWYLVEQPGDDLLIEVGPEFGAIGNFRFNFRFTAEAAFTVTRTIHHGIVHPNDLRYIRVGPPLDQPPAKVVPPPQAPKPAEKPPDAPGDPPP